MSVVHGADPLTEAAEHEVAGRSNAWWGMIFFIASEALIFANLIAAYLYLEIRDYGTAFAFRLPNGDHLEVILPIINTVILLSSSLPARFAGASIARGKQRNFVLGLIGTIILGAIFLSLQAYEYTGLFSQNFTIAYKTFGSAFFTLTGFHGLHVTIGLIFLIIILIRAIRGDFTANRHFAAQAAEMYWHFVDGVWIVVFTTVYLLPLLIRQ
jgi:cytochrome c oxidase subunit 3